LSRVFLACGSVGRKANGKEDHDLPLMQDFEQLLTGNVEEREGKIKGQLFSFLFFLKKKQLSLKQSHFNSSPE